MRAAIINTVYERGSTGNLAKELYEYATSNHIAVYAFYGRGEKYNDPHIVRIDNQLEVACHKLLSMITGLQGYFSNFATTKLIRCLKKNKINFVILLNLHGYYLNESRLLRFLSEQEVGVVYITPDEYAALGKCVYHKSCINYESECHGCKRKHEYPQSLLLDQSRRLFRMKKCRYEKLKHIIFAGPRNNIDVFRKSALTKDKKQIEINWGVNTKIYRNYMDESVYKKYKIPKGKVIILTAAPYSIPRKGVEKYFFPAAQSLCNTNLHFINVGYDGNLPKEEIPPNMTVIPYISDQEELAKIYSISDAYVLASTEDTQPVSCLIALSCGTPIICFDTGGLRYLAPHDNMIATYIERVDLEDMVRVLKMVKKKEKSVSKLCRAYAEDRYSNKQFAETIFGLYGDIM